MSTEFIQRDLSVLWHPCTQMKDHESFPPIPIRRGQGIWLEDMQGKRYMDAISSWWVNLFGHSNPRINAVIKEQLDILEQVMLAGFSHEPVVQLSEKLVQLTPPGLNRCFYASDGASAVEIALKMSFHYWHNKGQRAKTRFITLDNSYHGETLGALSLGSMPLFKKIYAPLLLDTIVAPTPDCYHREKGVSCEEHSREMFVHIDTILQNYANEVCAVIVEPLIQGAGSMRMYHPVYLTLLREACNRYNVHLIADEIAVGFGRTGTMFACEQAEISPDFICLSKGLTGGYLPLSVTLTRDEIYAAFYDDYENRTAFLHSHSYAGNPLACRAALETLNIFEEEQVLENNLLLAGHIRHLSKDMQNHPHIAEVRQHGMVMVAEMVKNKTQKIAYPWQERRGLKVHQNALQKGVLLRPMGNAVYIMPPYIITEEQISELITIMLDSIDVATRD